MPEPLAKLLDHATDGFWIAFGAGWGWYTAIGLRDWVGRILFPPDNHNH